METSEAEELTLFEVNILKDIKNRVQSKKKILHKYKVLMKRERKK